MTKDATTPHTCHYITLWNLNVQYLIQYVNMVNKNLYFWSSFLLYILKGVIHADYWLNFPVTGKTCLNRAGLDTLLSIKRRYFCDDALDKLTLSKLQKTCDRRHGSGRPKCTCAHRRRRHRAGGGTCPPQSSDSRGTGAQRNLWGTSNCTKRPQIFGTPTYANTVWH